MKKGTRKLLGVFLGMVMLIGMSISAMAAPVKNNSIDTNSSSASKEEISSNQTKYLNKSMSGESKLLPSKVGESKVVSQDENGTMTVTLVEASDDGNGLTRGATTSSRGYIFQYKNALGISKDAFKVELLCSWYSNGENSYITNLRGTYTILDNSFICSWGDSYSSDAYHSLDLDVYHGGGSTYYIFSATVAPLSSPYIVFAYNAW